MIENQIIFQNEYNIRYMRENKKKLWKIVLPIAPKNMNLSELFTINSSVRAPSTPSNHSGVMK